MELDRSHNHFRTPTTATGGSAAAATDLFICFTSRLSSSSSMKLSKSLLSPGRAARDAAGPTSLSSSLSRRLRANGSLKGGASPFFATTAKKRGCAFENPEPSSPKVTCIGQVRVKTKKKVKRSRSLSRRRSGEISFRKIEQQQPCGGDGGQQVVGEDKIRYSNASAHYQPQECLPHRNQRWVHLPVSICEALRAFGAEFSCLFPCKSSCFSSAGERDEKAEKENGGCGAVFARWLVSVNDGEGGKRREIELVVGGGDAAEEEEEERMSMRRRSSRRHVFEDIEVKDDRIELKGESEEEEAGRVSICVPPKNALLLMRCRSDPMKMAALANRFSWDANDPKIGINGIQEEDEIRSTEENGAHLEEQEDLNAEEEEQVCDEVVSDEANEEVEVPIEVEEQIEEVADVQQEEMVEDKAEDFTAHEEEEEEEEVESNMSSFEELLEQENTQSYEDCPIQDKEEVEDNPVCHLSPSSEEEVESSNIEAPSLLEEAAMAEENEATDESISSETEEEEEEEEIKHVISELKSEPEEEHQEEEEEEQTGTEMENKGSEEPLVVSGNEEVKRERGREREKVLPECLLLMMCEPKLSMEVSKETWVCSTDFIRWLPERPRKATAAKPGKADHEPVKRRLSIDSKPKATAQAAPPNEQLPPRSSCSLSMATMIEQKLVNAVGYEPFVLTRCKSEPMRTAAAKLMPESCFWKNAMRKLEPHRRGVGAAGVGF